MSQNKPSNVRKNPVIPNWNQNVKAAHAAARQSYLTWIKLQKPTAGLAYESTINSRKTFKYVLRKTKSMNDQLFADNIAASLTSGQSSPNFWKHINLANYNKYKTPVFTCVNGQTGNQNIANMWEDHYKSLMNFPETEAESVAKQFVHQTLSNCDLNKLNPLPLCDVGLIQAQLHKLKRKCAPGLDNICTEHLIYSHPLVSVHISMLFNLCLTHGLIPNRCIASMITPVVKSNKNSVRDVNNYRPIALASTFSKLFELILLKYLESFLHTCDNQFGFKSGHGTDSCVFLLKQAINHYNQHDTPLYAIFLDSSKAFDRVCHYILFQKLIEKQVPLILVRFIMYWYKNQMITIKWNNVFSRCFSVTNGVRQGGIMSPYLFNIYMDQLSVKLNQLNIGCCIGDKCLNNLMYADDICCFAPSFKGLQRLVDTCVEFAAKHNIVFNCRKTKAMYFPCKFFKTTDHNLTVNDQHVEFVNSIKYLGVTISSVLSDELDIKARVRSIYCIANMLRTRFFKCSVNAKNILFRYFCSSIYGINLWCRYPASSINRLRVAYNNAYRILFNLPRRIHINETMVNNGISTFYSLMRKHTANFIIRCKHSPNAYIQQIFGSACFLDSYFSVHYSKLHFG